MPEATSGVGKTRVVPIPLFDRVAKPKILEESARMKRNGAVLHPFVFLAAVLFLLAAISAFGLDDSQSLSETQVAPTPGVAIMVTWEAPTPLSKQTSNGVTAPCEGMQCVNEALQGGPCPPNPPAFLEIPGCPTPEGFYLL